MYGNRSLDIAKSRYKLNLSSNGAREYTHAGSLTDSARGGRLIISVPPAVPMNIDPMFQSARVSVRSIAICSPWAEGSEAGNQLDAHDTDATLNGITYRFNSTNNTAHAVDGSSTNTTSYDAATKLMTIQHTPPAINTPSIRDASGAGGPARYKPTSEVELGVAVDGAEGGSKKFKWSAAGKAFQINLESHPDLLHDTSEHPAAGTVSYWNGDRWTSTSASVFLGLPANLEAAIVHPEFPHKVLFFKSGSMYTYNLDTTVLESTDSVASLFPQFTGTIANAYRTSAKGNNADGEMTFWHLRLYNTDGDLFRWEYAYPSTGAWTFLDTHAAHQDTDITARSEGWNAIFKKAVGNANPTVEKNPNTGIYVAYGAGTGIYEGLPTTTAIDASWYDKVGNKSYATIGSTLYKLNVENKTVESSEQYGAALLTANHLDDGNWGDGSDYTLEINTTASAMPVYKYGTSDPVSLNGIEWTITGWGNTVLYGVVKYDSTSNKTRLIVSTDADGRPLYRPFVLGSWAPANPQEAFTKDMWTELVAYEFTGTVEQLQAGATLTPTLMPQTSADRSFQYQAVDSGKHLLYHDSHNKQEFGGTAIATKGDEGFEHPQVWTSVSVAAQPFTPLVWSSPMCMIRLIGASQPNNQEQLFASQPQAIQSSLLGSYPLEWSSDLKNFIGMTYRAANGAVDDGVLIAGTLVNQAFDLELSLPPGLVPWDDPATRGNKYVLPTIYYELDVQLLKNELEDAATCN